jgi:transcriptional regulator with XRE-family HTH domain
MEEDRMTRRQGRSPSDRYDVDRRVGEKIRRLRQDQGLSQAALAKSLNVSFQQVQKYEQGANRVSASRLDQIAAVFGIPIDDFFSGLPTPARTQGQEAMRHAADLGAFARSREGRELFEAFQGISDPAQRRSISHLIRILAGEDDHD